MRKLANFLVHKKTLVIIFFSILFVVSAYLSFKVSVNYDSSKYLSDETKTKQGLEIMYDEFGENGNLQVMIKGVSFEKALTIKEKLAKIENVEQVIWIDDILAELKPAELSLNDLWQLINSDLFETNSSQNLFDIFQSLLEIKPSNATEEEYLQILLQMFIDLPNEVLDLDLGNFLLALENAKPNSLTKEKYWALLLSKYTKIAIDLEQYEVTNSDEVNFNFNLVNLLMVINRYPNEINLFQNNSELLFPETIKNIGYVEFISSFVQLFRLQPNLDLGEMTNLLNKLMNLKPTDMSNEKYFDGLIKLITKIPADLDFASLLSGQIATFYHEQAALFQVTFTESAYSDSTIKAIEDIKKLDIATYLYGEPYTTYNSIKVVNGETTKGMIIAVIIIIIILLLTSTSYIEPVIFLITIGVGVIINMGTNYFLGDISYMTKGVSALLQVALTIDYAIFLMHRYKEELKEESDVTKATVNALLKSVGPIFASSLTTIAGFVALMFMSYQIGLDMGIVFVKGIIISIITVFCLMPILLILFRPLILKTEHKTFKFEFQGFARFLKKTRIILPIILILVIVPCYLNQQKNNFVFGNEASLGGEDSAIIVEKKEIENKFGRQNQLVILLPQSAKDSALEISNLLLKKNGVIGVQSLGLIEISKMDQILPSSFMKQFQSENYLRIIVNLDCPEESAETAKIISDIEEDILAAFNLDYYLLGNSSSTMEIKTEIESDYTIIMAISIILIAIIICITFKSWLIPLLLVLVIQSSIWINMAAQSVITSELIFIGYLIVSTIQLGATIDYAILFTNRYLESRQKNNKYQAMMDAVKNSFISIITSGGILCISGFILGFSSTLPSISTFGTMVGIGTLCSVVLVLVLLPQLLVLFDKFVVPKKYKNQINHLEDEEIL